MPEAPLQLNSKRGPDVVALWLLRDKPGWNHAGPRAPVDATMWKAKLILVFYIH